MMKNGKAADAAGVVAEVRKHADEALYEMIAAVFNEVLLDGELPPDEWKHTRIRVLFKKGDAKSPSNYRPISLLPILYNLFTRVSHERLKPYLPREQSVDQAGFWPGFSCDNHLLTLVLIH